jgi:hypothetical protein
VAMFQLPDRRSWTGTDTTLKMSAILLLLLEATRGSVLKVDRPTNTTCTD